MDVLGDSELTVLCDPEQDPPFLWVVNGQTSGEIGPCRCRLYTWCSGGQWEGAAGAQVGEMVEGLEGSFGAQQ